MRPIIDEARLKRFMRALGNRLKNPTCVYLVGGGTAVLGGWRESTIDIDLKIVPDNEAFAILGNLKHELDLNIEFAAPDQFIPSLPGWEDRSMFVSQEGRVAFYHYDPYSQALAKVERGFARDLADVAAMLRLGWIESTRALDLYSEIEPQLDRYPAIDPPTFREAVETTFGG